MALDLSRRRLLKLIPAASTIIAATLAGQTSVQLLPRESWSGWIAHTTVWDYERITLYKNGWRIG